MLWGYLLWGTLRTDLFEKSGSIGRGCGSGLFLEWRLTPREKDARLPIVVR